MKRSPRRAAALLGLVTLLLLAPAAAAQRGFDTTDLPAHGLRYLQPRSYDWLPVQPTEDWIVLRYSKKPPRGEDGWPPDVHFVPELLVVRIDWVPDEAPAAGGRSKGSGDDEKENERENEEDGEEEGEGDADDDPEDAPPPPINSALRWFARRGGGWTLGESEEGRERDDFIGTAYALVPPERSRGKLAGWAYVWRKERERTYVVLGRCEQRRFEEEQKIWSEVATNLRFSEPAAGEASKVRRKWERRYARMGSLDPEFRIRVRERLGGTWDADDTDNYIVVYNTPDEPLVRRILRDLEGMRAEYERLFPAAEPVTAVSTVRICADRDEYLLYGGMPGSAGYWNSSTEELVLYDATYREKGERTDKSNTFVVLYHEAFHQYVHYSVGRLAPHSWFNEGYGDYFSGADVRGGRVKRIDQNPWRNDFIKRVVEAGKSVPWDEILFYEQRDYYRNAAVCYAQGWSMIYFLNHARAVERDAQWRNLLGNYFETLKQLWREESERLRAEGAEDDRAAVAEAQQRARHTAAERTFEHVDLAELDEAWQEFVRELDWLDEPR